MAKQGEHGISWTDETWNPVRGCSRVSEGCRNCYAERVAARFSGPGESYEGLARMVGIGHDNRTGKVLKTVPRWTGDIRLVPEHLQDPLHWTRPRRVFVNSMSDIFHEGVPTEWLHKMFAVMALAGKHQFQILTKRPERMATYMEYLSHGIKPLEEAARDMGHSFNWQGHPLLPWPIPNIWTGVSVEDQISADLRLPLLLQTPTAIRWVSYEPALGEVNFASYLKPAAYGDSAIFSDRQGLPGRASIHWLVAGGESGPHARPCHEDWIRSARDQCKAAGVPFHFKQWGEFIPFSELPDTMEKPGLLVHRFEDGTTSVRVGKRAAGRTLDRAVHDEFPDPRFTGSRRIS